LKHSKRVAWSRVRTVRLSTVALVVILASPAAAQQPADSLLIDVPGRQLILHNLDGMPRERVTVSFHDSPPLVYSGVSVRNLLAHAGLPVERLRGRTLAQYMIVEAKDGYRVSFGVADLDSALVSRRLVLVDSVAGEALSPEEGPWRLIVAGDGAGAGSVRMVTAIRVRDP
jgi:hypothetical protein